MESNTNTEPLLKFKEEGMMIKTFEATTTKIGCEGSFGRMFQKICKMELLHNCKTWVDKFKQKLLTPLKNGQGQ